MPCHVQSVVRACATVMLLAGATATSAVAQPGPPTVTINADQSIVLNYVPQGAIPAAGASIDATYNGLAIPGTPFFIGHATTVATAPLPPGTYTAQIQWPGVGVSAVTSFTIGPLGAPTIRVAAADLDTVVLAWDPPASGPVHRYELEATVVRTGQVVHFTLGDAPGATFRNVPPGLFRVRVRAVNAFGAGPYSAPSADIPVGTIVPGGDLQVSLTWNSTADMDLHVREPDGGHVYWGRLQGRSARLDFDDANGFGPENVVAPQGLAMPGYYQIFVVHNSQDQETTSTIAVTLGAASGNPSTSIFTRRTRRAAQGTAVLVATVNVLTGEIVEMLGTGGVETRNDIAGDVPAKAPPQ